MHLTALAVLAGPRLEMLLVAIVDEGVEAFGRHDPHIAALTAVAAVGAAVGNELLAPEGDAACAAVAGTNEDLTGVEEFHGSTRFKKGRAGLRKTASRLRCVLYENEHKINDLVLRGRIRGGPNTPFY